MEPVYNGHLGTRYIWPLYTSGCYRENLYKVVSSILVAMAVINERLLSRDSRQPQCSNILVQKGQGELVMNVGYSY